VRGPTGGERRRKGGEARAWGGRVAGLGGKLGHVSGPRRGVGEKKEQAGGGEGSWASAWIPGAFFFYF